MFLKSKNKKFKINLNVGDYDSVVTFADYNPDYTDDAAFLFRYELTSADGRKFTFKETFLNDERNERTTEFFDYLEQNGIEVENFRSFRGCKEKVSLKKNATMKGTFLTIAARQFIEHAKEE